LLQSACHLLAAPLGRARDLPHSNAVSIKAATEWTVSRVFCGDDLILQRKWLQQGKKVLSAGRRVFPVLVSGGLITWLVWSITPQKLFAAFSTWHWPWLVLVTAVQVLVTFAWDTVTLWWLFSQPTRWLSFRTLLRARSESVLWSAINLEIGQGVFAYKVAQIRGDGVLTALGRFMVLALFDAGTLQALALIGSFLRPDPLILWLRWICVVVVGGLLVLAALLKLLPRHWRQWLESKSWGEWLRWWTWRHSVLLVIQRLILFLMVLLYAWICLTICGIPTDARTIFGTIPFVILAESLPGTGGLGERETALVYLLHVSEDQRAVVLSFGLIWSAVVILGRVTIGLVSSWLPQAQGSTGEQTEVADSASDKQPSLSRSA
jgi:hypothetical protein